MNTTSKNIIRALVLVALAAIALIGIFSEPSKDSATWYLYFIASKGIGLIALYVISKLNERWSMIDQPEK